MKATNVVACASVCMPLWFPSLSQVSEWAALWTPILGAIWLVIQIMRWLWQTVKSKDV